MKYIKYTKRKYYETWHSRSCGCVIYVFKLPNKNIYHFSVICPDEFSYSSLEEQKLYNSFNETDRAVEDWLDKNLRK